MKKEHFDMYKVERVIALWLLELFMELCNKRERWYLRGRSCRVLSCPSQARTMRRGANTAGKKWSLMKQNTISDTGVSSLKCLQGVKSSHFPLLWLSVIIKHSTLFNACARVQKKCEHHEDFEGDAEKNLKLCDQNKAITFTHSLTASSKLIQLCLLWREKNRII